MSTAIETVPVNTGEVLTSDSLKDLRDIFGNPLSLGSFYLFGEPYNSIGILRAFGIEVVAELPPEPDYTVQRFICPTQESLERSIPFSTEQVRAYSGYQQRIAKRFLTSKDLPLRIGSQESGLSWTRESGNDFSDGELTWSNRLITNSIYWLNYTECLFNPGRSRIKS